MSFNIWRSGGLSLETTASVIANAKADIVGLQECSIAAAEVIAKAMGYAHVADENGHVILSRHPITKIGSTANVWGGLGATITIDTQRVHVFNAHLHWDHYGPYWFQEERSARDVLAEEQTMRMPGLEELFAMMKPMLQSKTDPTFLIGDFNAPSHLDYVNMPWPTSLACEAQGLADSYRLMHPTNRRSENDDDGFAYDEPGITWSPMLHEEPRGCFDRIDFIHFTSAVVTASTTLDTHAGKSWPSDHRAVISDFRF